MRALLLAVLVLGVLAAPAGAKPYTGHGVLHSPNGAYNGHSPGYWLAQWWAEALSTPAGDDNPAMAGGCVVRGKVALHYGGDCTVRPGTAIFEMAFSVECSDREDPPFHADNAREATACAKEASSVVEGLDLSIDGGPDLDVFDDAFATSMPWTTVDWPEDNIYGIPGGGKISFGGYGWVALIKPMPKGRHTVVLTSTGEGAGPPVRSVITVR